MFVFEIIVCKHQKQFKKWKLSAECVFSGRKLLSLLGKTATPTRFECINCFTAGLRQMNTQRVH